MPLFMFISGYVSYKKNRDIDFKWIKTRFLCLVLPFISWILLRLMFDHNFLGGPVNCFKAVVKSPDNGYWFLWILFLLCVINYISSTICKLLRVKHTEIVTILIVLLIMAFFNIGYLGIPFVCKYSVYYFGGYYINQYKDSVKNIVNVLGALSGLIWILTVQYWRVSADYPFMNALENYVNNTVGESGILHRILFNGSIKLYEIIIAYGGIAIVAAISYVLYKWICINVINNAFSYLGKHTLEIYVLHFFFFGFVQVSSPILSVLVNFVMILAFSLLIIWGIEKDKLNLFLFGKK